MPEEIYKGPIVYVVHPMLNEPKGIKLQAEHYRIQIKHHRQRISKLLNFAKSHGLPVVFEPWNQSNREDFFELAEREGIAREEIVLNHRPRELKEGFSPTRVIVAGSYRGRCVKEHIKGRPDIKTTGILDVFPNAEVILLEGSYSVREPGRSADLARHRRERMNMLRAHGVKFSKKLGNHLLNPSWPVNAARRHRPR